MMKKQTKKMLSIEHSIAKKSVKKKIVALTLREEKTASDRGSQPR
jgi:hypothetical protein